jgi:hypothetical protein
MKMPRDTPPDPSLRRTLEQIVHCAEEALSVVENEEVLEHAENDLRQAKALIDVALRQL